MGRRGVFVICLLVVTGCSRRHAYREVIVPPGNAYIAPMDPAEDDGDRLVTAYSQFSSEVKRRIEQVLPGGAVDKIVHWGPFRYIVYKSYPEGYGYKLYIYLDTRIRQVVYLKGAAMERPGLFFVKGEETGLPPDRLPPAVLTGVRARSGTDRIVGTWFTAFDGDTTVVVEVTGFQEADTTAFAFRTDGVLKTLSEASRMRIGLDRRWTAVQVDDFFAPFRERYDVDRTIRRIQDTPFDPDRGFRFAVLGDPQSNERVWSAVCRGIRKKKPVFTVITGDHVSDAYPDIFRRTFIEVHRKHGRFEIIPVIGNHDTGDDGMALSFRNLFGPQSLNYAFDYGNARFVIFDACSRASDQASQLDVLDRMLAETPEGFHKFVFSHYPPGNVEKWAYHSMDIALSRRFTEIMTRHAVDHVFHGHIHAYSTACFHGVEYTVNGGSGGSLHDRYGPNGSINHYIIVDVTPEGVSQRVVQIHFDETGTD